MPTCETGVGHLFCPQAEKQPIESLHRRAQCVPSTHSLGEREGQGGRRPGGLSLNLA